ncbi:MAG: response regulator [Cyanobacteria bacterium SBLK]|nr:response regulator [Cyanobacteria bacterium SBLK]
MNTRPNQSNILIVDDNLNNLGVLSTILTSCGYKIRKAVNGKIALMGVRAEIPDLILLDILMPDMDGYEVCQQLKSNPNTAEIPIVFLSALGETVDKIRGFKVGGADYITKPFEVEEVLARVEHQLQIQSLQKTLQKQNLQLKEREHRLKTILASMSDGLIVLDGHNKVRFINPAAPKLLNKTEEELRDRDFEWEIAIGGTREVRIGLTSEKMRILAIDAENTTWNEEPAVLLSLKDITHRKETEIALKQAKETAEAASQTKSTFLSSVSHELRTPLHAIIGFSTLFARENLTSQQQENLDLIKKSGEHLQELINDILFISKLESGLELLHLTMFDFSNFLSFMYDLFARKAQQKNLQLLWECDTNLPQYITCDRSKLRQILLNLIGNAIDYTEQGKIVVRVSQQPTSGAAPLNPPKPLIPFEGGIDCGGIQRREKAHQETNNIYFEIEDTGIGISPKNIETLFDPFMQVTKERKYHRGTGLGLSISQKFAQLMGSQIQVTSTLGKGSLFSFCIPSIPQLSERATDSNSCDLTFDIHQGDNEKKNITRPLQKKDLQIMTSEWIEKFHQASLELNTKKMLQLIEVIPQNETFLIHSLQNLVNDFRIDIIQEITLF